MGWASGTRIFDTIIKEVIAEPTSKPRIIRAVIKALRDGDWDTMEESRYFDHPLVYDQFAYLYPQWYSPKRKIDWKAEARKRVDETPRLKEFEDELMWINQPHTYPAPGEEHYHEVATGNVEALRAWAEAQRGSRT